MPVSGSRFWLSLTVPPARPLAPVSLPTAVGCHRMDDIPDTCWSWPHWKFGLKGDDLFTTLHDRYNTIPSPILDAEAFHHDVFEIAHRAESVDEFHRLLEHRRRQRLRELKDTLESLAFEITGNPSLIGIAQWPHAVHLFRTQSLDSLVRYFASYMPSDHPWCKSVGSASNSETASSVGSGQDSHGPSFDDGHSVMTDETSEYPSSPDKLESFTHSPRSLTVCSDSSAASPIDDARPDFDLPPLTPVRTLSFSESEPDCCSMTEPHDRRECEGVSQHAKPPPTAVSAAPVVVEATDSDAAGPTGRCGEGDGAFRLLAVNVGESETPTPKPEPRSARFFDDAKPPLPQRRHRSLSPSRPQPLSERDLEDVRAAYRDPRHSRRSRLRRERESSCGPVQGRWVRRRNPTEPAARIQRPLQVVMARPRGRKWV